MDDVIERFPEYSAQQIRDALDSAIEDEYFEQVTRENGTLWYTPITYDDED